MSLTLPEGTKCANFEECGNVHDGSVRFVPSQAGPLCQMCALRFVAELAKAFELADSSTRELVEEVNVKFRKARGNNSS